MASILVLVLVAGGVLLYLSQKPTITEGKKRLLRIFGWILLGLGVLNLVYFLYIIT